MGVIQDLHVCVPDLYTQNGDVEPEAPVNHKDIASICDSSPVIGMSGSYPEVVCLIGGDHYISDAKIRRRGNFR